MITLSNQFIQHLKESIDIVELVGRYTQLTWNSSVYIGKCPRPRHHEHGIDGSPSFRVVPKSQSWFCGACHSGKKDVTCQHGPNYGSDVIAFMQWMHDLNFFEACKKLAKMYDIQLEADEYAHLYKQQYHRAKSYNMNLSGRMRSYLYARGCTDETIERFCIGDNGEELTIPLLNRQKQYIGFTKRGFHPDKPKYKNSANSDIFNKSSYLFGIHLLEREHPEIYISEGAFDMILPHQFGLKNVVATLGTSFTEKHVEIIRNLGKIPVICMDGDQAGFRSIQKIADLFAANGVYCKILILPDKIDLADLSIQYKEETSDYIDRHAIPYGSFLLQNVLKQYEAKMDEVNTIMLPLIKEALSQVRNTDEKKVLLDRVFRNTGLRL